MLHDVTEVGVLYNSGQRNLDSADVYLALTSKRALGPWKTTTSDQRRHGACAEVTVPDMWSTSTLTNLEVQFDSSCHKDEY